MDVPSCLQKDVRLGHGQRWAGALRFNPFAILRGMDRKQSHPSSISVSQRPLGTRGTPPGQADVSETGARLTVDGSIEGLPLKEFFLLLSTMGKAYRRCQLAWVNGNQVGVFFLKPSEKKKKP